VYREERPDERDAPEVAMRQEEKEKKENQISRDQLVQTGRKLFDELSAPDSGIRGFSEALRGNVADEYDRVATGNAFESGLPENVRRLGEIAERFSRVREDQ